jgi:hypothetical protein
MPAEDKMRHASKPNNPVRWRGECAGMSERRRETNMDTNPYDQKAFLRFHEQSIAHLERFIQRHFPSGEIHFYPFGEICVFTGIWAGEHQIKIWTGVFEGQDDTCNAWRSTSGPD